MNQPASPATRKTTMWIAIAVAGVAFVAAGSYISDIPPSSSNVAGTVQPAQRYRAEQQLTAQDVKLADQTLAQALQSDVVVKLIKDPQFQALAHSPAALSALAVNVQAFAALAQEPKAFAMMVSNASAFAALSSNAQVFAAVLNNPSAFAQYASNAKAFATAASNASAVAAMSANASAFQALASNSQAMAAIA